MHLLYSASEYHFWYPSHTLVLSSSKAGPRLLPSRPKTWQDEVKAKYRSKCLFYNVSHNSIPNESTSELSKDAQVPSQKLTQHEKPRQYVSSQNTPWGKQPDDTPDNEFKTAVCANELKEDMNSTGRKMTREMQTADGNKETAQAAKIEFNRKEFWRKPSWNQNWNETFSEPKKKKKTLRGETPDGLDQVENKAKEIWSLSQRNGKFSLA